MHPAEKKDEGGTTKFCPIHNTRQHDLRECRLVKNLAEQRVLERASGSGKKDGQNNDDAELGFQNPEHTVACLHGGAPALSSRRGLKLFRREVCAVTPALEAS